MSLVVSGGAPAQRDGIGLARTRSTCSILLPWGGWREGGCLHPAGPCIRLRTARDGVKGQRLGSVSLALPGGRLGSGWRM